MARFSRDIREIVSKVIKGVRISERNDAVSLAYL